MIEDQELSLRLMPSLLTVDKILNVSVVMKMGSTSCVSIMSTTMEQRTEGLRVEAIVTTSGLGSPNIQQNLGSRSCATTAITVKR